MISHIEREIDEVLGGSKVMASTLGRKLAPKLPRYFSDVILAEKTGAKFSWSTAAIWTGPKFVGGNDARDMNITPAMGVVEVRRIKKAIKLEELQDLLVFPNPNDGIVNVQFRVEQESQTEVMVSDMIGRKVMEVLNTKMPAGDYKYVVNLTKLEDGFYFLSVKTDTKISTSKIIINK
jgi:hypothetical protein